MWNEEGRQDTEMWMSSVFRGWHDLKEIARNLWKEHIEEAIAPALAESHTGLALLPGDFTVTGRPEWFVRQPEYVVREDARKLSNDEFILFSCPHNMLVTTPWQAESREVDFPLIVWKTHRNGAPAKMLRVFHPDDSEIAWRLSPNRDIHT